jgi:hypothetical protein
MGSEAGLSPRAHEWVIGQGPQVHLGESNDSGHGEGVERGKVAPPSEETTLRLARELNVDGDTLLALAGKVSTDLKEVIRKRPQLFAELIRGMKDLPDHAVLRLVREVREGDW